MNTYKRTHRVIAIAVLLLLITGIMYIAEGRWAAAPVLRYLYLIPIAQAALVFGLTGSMTVALLADLLFAPLVAVAVGRYGIFGAPTVELLMTLGLMPLLAYFAGSGWGRLARQQELYQFLSGMGDLFGRSLPRNELLAQVLEQGAKLIDAGGGEIVLVQGDSAEIAAQWGIEAEAAAESRASLAHHIMREDRVWRAMGLDYDADYRRVGAGPRIDSALAVPLHIEGHPVGVLAFYNRPGGFGRHEQAAVEAMGSKVEVVLENFRQMEQRAERERLQREFDLAAEVQGRFLPTAMPQIAGYHVAGQTISAREIGGDFFSFAPLSDGRWYIAVGDVSGKGVVGAFFMAIATSVIDIHLQGRPGNHAIPLLNTLNPLFYARMASQKINTALCYVLLDPLSGEVQIGNAGLIAPLHVQCADGPCEYVDVIGLPLGVLSEVSYGEGRLRLAPGEALIIVSDGVVEAQNGDRQLFGLDTLQNLVKAENSANPHTLSNVILDAARTWSRGDLHDDMTAVVIRRNAS
ncbi:MAG: SpoIIE family protein phosphatase [Herpetosiphonaceae bacterium]|nr:SpoIIE family protein phosphatase [Herpetosiphonaceae bacterium]